MNTARKSPSVTKRASKNEWLAIVEALNHLMADRLSEDEVRNSKRKEKRAFDKRTLATLNEAYAATLRYYVDLLGGGTRSVNSEAAIGGAWRQAGRLLRRYDPVLSSRLTVRDGFWSQDLTWAMSTVQKAWVGLNAIRVSANLMDPDRAAERWSTRS